MLLSNTEASKTMYLVTGGCGFIGSHLVDLLIQKNYRVRVIDDLSNSLKKNLSPKAEFFFGSVTEEKIMSQALEGVNGVFHLAAMVSVPASITQWHKTHLINCGGTVRLFELAKKIPIVLASTAAIYGNSKALPNSEKTCPNPLSPYAVDKLASEMHAKVAWSVDKTPSISCRFFNVYGPRQNPTSPYSGVISKFVSRILRQEPIIIYGDGNQSRDFIYVKDIAKMLVHVMEIPFKGAQVYNFCRGVAYTINELVDTIGQITGLEIKKEYAEKREGDVYTSIGDPSKIFDELGVKASISLEDGLKEYLKN